MPVAKRRKPVKKPKSITYKPPDWLKGSKTPGGKYTAWNTYGQGKPDFGKGAGPGEPYHLLQKKVPKPPRPGAHSSPVSGSTLPAWGPVGDPRIEAIRRRLRGL